MTKAQRDAIQRRNNRPYMHIYPSTTNLYEQIVLSIPKGAKRKDVIQAMMDVAAHIPGLTVKVTP